MDQKQKITKEELVFILKALSNDHVKTQDLTLMFFILNVFNLFGL